jgi:transposase
VSRLVNEFLAADGKTGKIKASLPKTFHVVIDFAMPPAPPAPNPNDSPEVAELKRQLQAAHQQLQAAHQQLQAAHQKLEWAELKIQLLEEKLRLAGLRKYGPAGERLSSAQLALLELEPGVSEAELEAEAQREPLPEAPAARRKAARPHPGRHELPADLPRRERVIACPPEEQRCPECGRERVVIGYETSEQLDVEPARYFVLVMKREKRACPGCPQAGVAVAPAPPRIVEKGLVSDRVVVDAIVAKYADHLPLYRQSVMLRREAGLEISRATLDGWVMRVGELLTPVVAAMRRELLAGTYIQADETPVAVQMHDGRGRNGRGWLWQYSHPRGNVVFEFRPGRSRDGPREFLAGFEGILQTDGYAAYEQVGGPGLVQAACWAHVRRKFYEAAQLAGEDGLAARIVARVDELFALDSEARERGLDLAARQALRRERAPQLLVALRSDIEAAQRCALPASALGKAAAYALALWPKLVRFLDYPELELSNNLAEIPARRDRWRWAARTRPGQPGLMS